MIRKPSDVRDRPSSRIEAFKVSTPGTTGREYLREHAVTPRPIAYATLAYEIAFQHPGYYGTVKLS